MWPKIIIWESIDGVLNSEDLKLPTELDDDEWIILLYLAVFNIKAHVKLTALLTDNYKHQI